MKPARFTYLRPSSLEDVLRLLSEDPEETRILAGGQSLLPVLRLRMADPSLIIDVGGIPELRGVREDGDRIVVGAMTSHHDVTRDDTLRRHVALIQEATKTVADPQVRHRGTLGGALVFVLDNAELCLLLGLDDLSDRDDQDNRHNHFKWAHFFLRYIKSGFGSNCRGGKLRSSSISLAML